MNELKLFGKHILLLLLYSPGKTSQYNEPVIGRTRIIKMIFLFDREIMKDFLKDSEIQLISFPGFEPWHYGPFSKEVYNDIEFFINNNFIDNTHLDSEMPDFELDEFEDWADDFIFDDEKALLFHVQNEECFKLTSKGVNFIKKKVYERLSNNQKEILISFKKGINESTLEAILRYTYLNYPEYTQKSKIKEHIFK